MLTKNKTTELLKEIERKRKISIKDKKYRESENGKIVRKRMRDKAKKEGRIKIWHQNYIKKHPQHYRESRERLKAKNPEIYFSRKDANDHLKKDKHCLFCNDTTDLQFHHLVYRVPSKQEDVVTLCRKCHTRFHTLSKNENRRGRLDVLKEEEEFLDEISWVINGNVTPELQKYIDNKLASIQEEIKLIEGGI